MRELDELFSALEDNAFRRRQTLNAKDRAYLHSRGMTQVLQHAADFVAMRLAPAEPLNDGKQTPWRGHPAFTAQHGTATCCRGCLEKWHYIDKGRALTSDEQRYVIGVIQRWLERHVEEDSAPTAP
jgi:Domain of unknown function (DUF4186)